MRLFWWVARSGRAARVGYDLLPIKVKSEGLRKLTHRVLAAQEGERKNFSHQLQNEIAQTLLGINVWLLTLKSEGRNNTQELCSEIAGTQRLVLKSASSVRRSARKLGNS